MVDGAGGPLVGFSDYIRVPPARVMDICVVCASWLNCVHDGNY